MTRHPALDALWYGLAACVALALASLLGVLWRERGRAVNPR